MAKIIKHQLFYPHPQEQVWNYITNPELVSQWLMKGDVQPVVGHEFTFTTKPSAEVEFDGTFYCKVLEAQPFDKFVYTWDFNRADGSVHHSVVTWTLLSKDQGTELTLVHRGSEGSETMPIFVSMDNGWLKNINKILQLLNTTVDDATQA